MLAASWAALAGLTLAFAAAGTVGYTPSPRVQAGVYLFGMVALNLPHGGYEHFENLRRRGLPFGAKYVAAYVTLAASFLALLFVAPVAGLALALGVAVAKGGHGDLRALSALVGDDHLRCRPQRALAAAVRGGAVMVVPMVAFPATFYGYSTYMVNMFDPGALSVGG